MLLRGSRRGRRKFALFNSVVLCDVGSRRAARVSGEHEHVDVFAPGVPESSGTSPMACQGSRAGSVGQTSRAFDAPRPEKSRLNEPRGDPKKA